MTSHIPTRAKVMIIIGLIIFGATTYVYSYILTLEYLDYKTNLPFFEAAQYLNIAGGKAAVFTSNPDLLAKYYKGPIYEIPKKGGLTGILQAAEEKDVRYLIVESTSIYSKHLIDLYYYSIYPNAPDYQAIPSEFRLVKASEKLYGIYLIGPEENHQVSYEAAIFSPIQNERSREQWKAMLESLGASTSIFDDTTIISNVNISKFDLVVFDDFRRSIDETERLYLEQSIEKGLVVIVSGISPVWLAGGSLNLEGISSWFGATVFSESPKEVRWGVKFTDNAREIINYLDLDHEYAFYTDLDWSTPTACVTQNGATVYAYRVDDPNRAATIFSHKFGKGTVTFIGPRYGFSSPDIATFVEFLRALILTTLA